MSIKDNIEILKEELSAEEKFLESVIKTESFYKKNKKVILGIVVAVLVGILASVGYNYIQEQNAKQANQLYMSLLNKPDLAKEEKLKTLNLKLYELYKMQYALKNSDIKTLEELKNNINDNILKDLISYQIASLKEKGLLNYTSSNNAILKEYALLNSAYIQLEKGNLKKAKEILNLIPPTSIIYQIAKTLKHYIK